MAAINTSSLHVFQILRMLAGAHGPLGVTDVARAMELSPSTVHRALSTLEAAGYIRRDATTTKYEIGLMPQVLGRSMLDRHPLRRVAAPTLRRLADASGETISLTVRVGWYGVRIAVVHGASDIYQHRRLGEFGLLQEQPASRVILASLPEIEIQRYRRFVRGAAPAAAAFADRAPFLRELAAITAAGCAIGTSADGLGTILALPVRGGEGALVAAIALAGPTVPAHDIETDPRVAAWRAEISRLEADIRTAPQHAADPFAHIPADDIQFTGRA